MTFRTPLIAGRGPWGAGGIAIGVSVLVMRVAGACSSRGQRSGKVRLSIATGGTGGVFYPYGGGIAKVIAEHIPNVEATA